MLFASLILNPRDSARSLPAVPLASTVDDSGRAMMLSPPMAWEH